MLKSVGEKLDIPHLNWHALRRAHQDLISEFRSEISRQLASSRFEPTEGAFL
jgi:hypothetical protein